MNIFGVCLQEDEAGVEVADIEPEGPLEHGEAIRASYGLGHSKKSSSGKSRDSLEAQNAQHFDLRNIATPEDINEFKSASFRRMLWLNKPEWKEGLLGLLGAIGFGFTNPFYAYVIASITIEYYANHSTAHLWHQVGKFAGILVALAFFFLGTNVLQHYNFAAAGEKLTKRIRERMLGSLLQFEVGWFDRDENSSGSVCSRLSTDANMVTGIFSLLASFLKPCIFSNVICVTRLSSSCLPNDHFMPNL